MLYRFSIRLASHSEVYVICQRHTEIFIQKVTQQGSLIISISDEKIRDAKCAFCQAEKHFSKLFAASLVPYPLR